MSSPTSTLTGTVDDTAAASAASRPTHDTGLLLLRVTVGLIMAAHGTQKLFSWFNGAGIDGTGQFFTMVGYPAGETLALVAGLTETFGGLALALGLLTPLAGSALVGTQINIIGMHWAGGFFNPQGIEFPLALLAAGVALTLTGPGRIAADRFLPVLRANKPVHGAVALAFGVVVGIVVLLTK